MDTTPKNNIKLDIAVVPVQLTPLMRERMTQIANGPKLTHDQVWAELLDAGLILGIPKE